MQKLQVKKTKTIHFHHSPATTNPNTKLSVKSLARIFQNNFSLSLLNSYKALATNQTFNEFNVEPNRPDRHCLESLFVGYDVFDQPWHILAKQEQPVVPPVEKK